MQSFRYPHFPDDCSAVHVALFTDVKNSAEIRTRIVRASQLEGLDGDAEREAVNFAFIDARLVRACIHRFIVRTYGYFIQICSLQHLQTAIYQAVLAYSQGSLRTKTVHSEILWALNPTNNVTQLAILEKYAGS